MFIHPIVVAGDGASTNINIFTKLGITHIAEVIDLAAVANNGFFGFDKIAHFGIRAQLGAGTNPRKGAQHCAVANGGLLNNGVGFYLNAVAYMAVSDLAVGAYMNVGPKVDSAFKEAVYVDKVVAAGAQCRADQSVRDRRGWCLKP